MSFYYSPTRLIHLDIPNIELQGLWIGEGEDDGFILLKTGDNYVITANSFAYILKVDGRFHYPVFSSEVGGAITWQSSYYSTYIVKNTGSADIWYYGTSLTVSSYGGNFWTGEIPTENSPSEFTPIGVALEDGESSVTIEYYWTRWQSKTFLGEYEPLDGATGTKIVGTPQWVDDSGTYYTRSSLKVDGNYTYGTIKFVDDKWIMGNIGDNQGWHEGLEPSTSSSVIFYFKKNDGSSASGTDKIVTFNKYIMGSNKKTAYIGEAALWR